MPYFSGFYGKPGKIKIKIEDYLRNHNELLYSSSLSKKDIEFITQK